MADEIKGVVTGGKDVAITLTELTPRAMPAVREAIVKTQYALQRIIQGQFLSGSPLHVRTGRLRASVVVDPIETRPGEITGPVGTNLAYASIQEHGGTIVPKHVQFLTIPLEAAKTAAGVTRYTAREIIENPGIGGFTGTFFAKGILFGKAGSSIEPLFALKSSVTLPARPFLAPGLEQVAGQFERNLTDALERAKNEAGL
jgi:phage gpG-like protein